MIQHLSSTFVVAGDEILDGYVTDCNIPAIALALHDHGVQLDRVAVVRDRVDEITEVLRDALQRRRPRLVVTSGGLGPTQDDITLEAVAAVLDRPLQLAEELAGPMRSIIDWIEGQGFQLDDNDRRSMMRLARVPQGAIVLRHREWLAAIICHIDGGIDNSGVTIVSLPGPPGHFATLLREVVSPRFIEGRGRPPFVLEVEHEYPETVLVPFLDDIRDRCPGVAIGSYPGTTMVVRFEGPRTEVETAAEVLQEALHELDRREGADRIKQAWRDDQPTDWDDRAPSSEAP